MSSAVTIQAAYRGYRYSNSLGKFNHILFAHSEVKGIKFYNVAMREYL